MCDPSPTISEASHQVAQSTSRQYHTGNKQLAGRLVFSQNSYVVQSQGTNNLRLLWLDFFLDHAEAVVGA